MELDRKFKIIVNSKECGTCSGPTPSAVAKKVVKKLCGTSSKAVRFSLKECKRGCERECGPYQGRMEKLDRPYKRDGKTITHRVVCGKVRKIGGGVKNENFGNELKEIKVRELNINDFKLPRLLLSYFNIKYIGPIPYLFLYSSENDKEKEYELNYKFAISNNCHIFMYKNGEIKLLNMNYVELAENRLFELLVQGSVFRNEQDVLISSGKIIDMIKKIYPNLKDIISCLENLHLMYERNK